MLRDLAGAMFWKKTHFNGLKRHHYDRPAWEAMKAFLSRDWFERVTASNGDPVADLLLQVWRKVEPSAEGPPRQWYITESTLNCRCCLGFALLGAGKTGELLGRLCPEGAPHGPTALALLNQRYRGTRSDFEFGQPDLLLAGERHLWLCEMKVGGSSNSVPYGAQQLLKYMQLARHSCAHAPGLKVTHVLLGPESRPRLVRNRTGWYVAPKVPGECARVDLEALAAARLPERWRARMDSAEYRIALEQTLGRTPFRLATYRQLLESAPPDAANITMVNQQWNLLVEDAARKRLEREAQ